ncbi:hypothetical protein CICLE_v10024439mg [Citrus x clementina]|uniref:Uncharacterized protein n=1 Tax=Citrus clementina TaxID=85681 RepID=V4TUI7_CITCL|nr:hypothetical protein CICLE_v10024439mg [Citrus x clementina]
MVRAPTYNGRGMKKGAWSKEEDDKLRAYILKYGHWNWAQLPKSGKSCRLRWMNYLRPYIKHGNYYTKGRRNQKETTTPRKNYTIIETTTFHGSKKNKPASFWSNSGFDRGK